MLAADDSLAEIRARSKFGMAIAAMIRMIATSISEKPFCFRIFNSSFGNLIFRDSHHERHSRLLVQLASHCQANLPTVRLRQNSSGINGAI
jgi:hypothetical protein